VCLAFAVQSLLPEALGQLEFSAEAQSHPSAEALVHARSRQLSSGPRGAALHAMAKTELIYGVWLCAGSVKVMMTQSGSWLWLGARFSPALMMAASEFGDSAT